MMTDGKLTRRSAEQLGRCSQLEQWLERIARACRVCGCTETNCRQCIDPKTGFGCHWVEANLCSRCAPPSWRVFRASLGDFKREIILLHEELGQVKAYSIRQALSNARERYQTHVAVMSPDCSKSLCSFKRDYHE